MMDPLNMKPGMAGLTIGGPRQRQPVEAASALGAGGATVRQLPEPVAMPGIARQSAGPVPVDSARVEAVRSAIAAGQYLLQPDRIAQAMIASEVAGRR